MELLGGSGEPDIRERPFEELPGLEEFNEYYRRNGGFVSFSFNDLIWTGRRDGASLMFSSS